MRLFAVLVVLALAVGGAAPPTRAPNRLAVYTTLTAEDLAPLKQAAEAAIPGLEIVWLRDEAAPLTARVIADKPAQRGDMIWGLSAFSLLRLENLALLEPYTPAGVAELRPRFVSDRRPMTWTGMGAVIAAICLNRTLAVEQMLPMPRVWQDLLNPALRRQVAMPSPLTSTDGLLAWVGFVTTMREGQAWDYVAALHAAGLRFVPDGAASCEGAARGDYALGISVDRRALALKSQGAPIEVLFPRDGLGYDIEGTAILKGTRNLELAQRLADFAVSRAAMEIYARSRSLVGHAGIAPAAQGLPPQIERQLVHEDFRSFALRRDAMMREWETRFVERPAVRN